MKSAIQQMKTVKIIITLALLVFSMTAVIVERDQSEAAPNPGPQEVVASTGQYTVKKVIDGDTIDVLITGETQRIRMIGINTPETVDPRKPVECFGREASNKMKSLLNGTSVILESDPTQGDRDKYGRLLRYVVLPDGTNVNKKLITEGYAYEYTYGTPYKYQLEFKAAQRQAEEQRAGLWGDTCDGKKSLVTENSVVPEVPIAENGSCIVKGNINAANEKIYHTPDCGTYSKTSIDESVGEHWFCTESEAVQAGWRKAQNCS